VALSVVFLSVCYGKAKLLDTDHDFGVGGDQKWVWKAFLRGHNVLFMDP
jgi:hypothetical protein